MPTGTNPLSGIDRRGLSRAVWDNRMRLCDSLEGMSGTKTGRTIAQREQGGKEVFFPDSLCGETTCRIPGLAGAGFINCERPQRSTAGLGVSASNGPVRGDRRQ